MQAVPHVSTSLKRALKCTPTPLPAPYRPYPLAHAQRSLPCNRRSYLPAVCHRAGPPAWASSRASYARSSDYPRPSPQVHYHIIPAPRRDPGSHAGESAPVPAPPAPGVPGGGGGGRGAGRPLTEKEMHWREMEARGDLREEDAARIVEMVRAQLAG